MKDFARLPQRRLRLLPACLLALVWQGCIFQSASSDKKPQAGMVRIAAAGHETLLGSTDNWARQDEEAPRMTASFDYDFFIDKTEVTQEQYSSLMGRNPATETFGRGGGYPIYNVTWYDAVLFCNARSKRAGLDTVYSYALRKQDANGRTYAMEGLEIHYETGGYRLPTEAEWEFAARGGVSSAFPWGDATDSTAAVKAAWYVANAAARTHEVGAFPSNPFGLKDMAGNVMEWVNDWKGPYAALTVKNLLGSRSPGLVPERVVKGGAFSYDLRYLRFSGRSANYPTLSSGAVEYVGFRCVLAAIPTGLYLSGGQTHGAMPVVVPRSAGVLQLFGHNQVKLVVVNATSATRTLAYMDFSLSPVTVHEFMDDSAVFTPVISPNGQWVAYANVDEGDARTGTVKIRRLAPGSIAHAIPVASAVIPRWWVDPVSSDTFLVYATNARDDLDPFWPSDQTHRIRISGGLAVGSAMTVASGGGYHDGLSNTGNHLITSYRRMRIRNVISGTDRVLFTGPQNGKPAGDTSQVCNVSMHPDFGTTPHMLLLDFGYSATSSVVGRPYGLHEILFRLDSAGNVASWYGTPQGFIAWQDVEWSNHSNFAVGTGQDESQGYPAVVGISLKNSVTAVLATGVTLRQPGLWVNPKPFNPSTNDPGILDSMGQYNTPARGGEQFNFASKMKVFWAQRDSMDLAIAGSSHFEHGIWPPSFTQFHAVNLGYSTGGVLGTTNILRHYVFPHAKKIRAVIFEVEPGLLFVRDGDYSWRTMLGQTNGYLYDQSRQFWEDGVSPLMDSLMPFLNTNPAFDARGGWNLPGAGWGSDQPPTYGSSSYKLPDAYVTENLKMISEVAHLAKNQGTPFVIAITPQSPKYKNTPYYGKYGPTWQGAPDVINLVKSLCDTIAGCRFYDGHQYGNHDYSSGMFVDEDHLATPGAVQFSQRLDSALVKWLSGGAP